MIECPSCGTRNRRGSKFCGNCGQTLNPSLGVGCPACDRLNPPGSAYCAFCGVQLLPSPAGTAEADQVPVAASPTSRQQENQPREVPSWLYEDQDSEPPVYAPALGAAMSPAGQTSKYLEDITGTLPSSAAWLPLTVAPGSRPEVAVPVPKTSRKKGCLGLLALLVAPLLSTR